MDISFKDGKAHEYCKIDLPEIETVQEKLMRFLSNSQSEVEDEELHNNGLIKTITVYVPCSHMDELRSLLISC